MKKNTPALVKLSRLVIVSNSRWKRAKAASAFQECNQEGEPHVLIFRNYTTMNSSKIQITGATGFIGFKHIPFACSTHGCKYTKISVRNFRISYLKFNPWPVPLRQMDAMFFAIHAGQKMSANNRCQWFCLIVGLPYYT